MFGSRSWPQLKLYIAYENRITTATKQPQQNRDKSDVCVSLAGEKLFIVALGGSDLIALYLPGCVRRVSERHKVMQVNQIGRHRNSRAQVSAIGARLQFRQQKQRPIESNYPVAI